MLKIIKSYLNFLWNSKNEHGVHSPFVFNLVTKCFYDKKKYPEYTVLKNFRKSLLADKNLIEVTDFGAGSKVFKSNKRQIAKIAKTAGISSKRAELLFRITNYFQLSQCQLQLQSRSFGTTFNNIECINTEFSSYLKNFQLPASNFQLIYFDGNHSKQATLHYFELLLPTITNETVWIFDDIHWSIEMEEAWEKIQQHPKVTVTIDTFQWGIVFFRVEQKKEHFVIRV
jgi:hypothetical protein